MKRFDMEIKHTPYFMGDGESYEVSPYESTNGEWVQWDDVEQLKAQRDELLNALNEFIRYDDEGGPLSFDTDAMWAQARKAITKMKGTN